MDTRLRGQFGVVWHARAETRREAPASLSVPATSEFLTKVRIHNTTLMDARLRGQFDVELHARAETRLAETPPQPHGGFLQMAISSSPEFLTKVRIHRHFRMSS